VAGQSVPNLVIATVGSGGQVSLYNRAGTVDLIADVAGWYPAGQSSGTSAEADAVCSDALTALGELPRPFVDPNYDLAVWAYGASVILHSAASDVQAAGADQLGTAIANLATAHGDLAVADYEGRFDLSAEYQAIHDALTEVTALATDLGTPACVQLGSGGW
jgi:hypothetical protein